MGVQHQLTDAGFRENTEAPQQALLLSLLVERLASCLIETIQGQYLGLFSVLYLYAYLLVLEVSLTIRCCATLVIMLHALCH